MNDNLEVSLVKYLCPICGKEAEEGIIMNSLLTESNAKQVRELNGKVIGFTDHACKDCVQYKGVYFIAIDASKSTPKNPYRTGQLVCIKKESNLVSKCEKYIITLKDGAQYCYIDYNLGKQLGLW